MTSAVSFIGSHGLKLLGQKQQKTVKNSLYYEFLNGKFFSAQLYSDLKKERRDEKPHSIHACLEQKTAAAGDQVFAGPYAEELRVATKAVQLACQLSVQVQDQIRRGGEASRTKEDKSPVTVAGTVGESPCHVLHSPPNPSPFVPPPPPPPFLT